MIGRKLVDLGLLSSVLPAEPEGAALIRTPGAADGVIQPRNPGELVAAALAGRDVHFVTGGRWSMHEFLGDALALLGPSSLHLSTYALSEFSARNMAIYMADGRLRELHMLIDYRAKVRYPEVHQLASNVATRIRLTQVHAKVTVLTTATTQITVVGSANWTENPRLEAGVITAAADVADFHKSWLEKSLIDGTPFK